MIRQSLRFLKYCWYHLCVRLFYLTIWDKKYLKSKVYSDGTKTFYSHGWLFSYHNGWGRILTGNNNDVPWPVKSSLTITGANNIIFDADDLAVFQTGGGYIQAWDKITIGKGTLFAKNVSIITANHDPMQINHHTQPQPVSIGKDCWIGLNVVILPGVVLGSRTVVGAGAVVTKSFPEGNCIIGGIPARKIRNLFDF